MCQQSTIIFIFAPFLKFELTSNGTTLIKNEVCIIAIFTKLTFLLKKKWKLQ